MPAEGMSGIDKAAVLLLSLGTEAAAEVMRHLAPEEVRRVSRALTRMRKIEREELEQVQGDFERTLQEGVPLALDGRQFALQVVSRALGGDGGEEREIVSELEEAVSGTVDLATVLMGVSPTALARLLEGEHPQIAALILAHLGSSQAAQAIALLPETMQADTVERLARLESVPTALASEVGSVLKDLVKGLGDEPGHALGGPRAVAEMMNVIDKETENRIFSDLEASDPDLASEIRSLMFTFEDLTKLDNRSLQTLLKEVPREDLLLALKTASPPLQEKIFANLSSRAAQILKDDMAAAGPVRLKDVEEAQARIVTVLRELESEGRVVIAGGGDDVLV